jgi:hypothetical protein
MGWGARCRGPDYSDSAGRPLTSLHLCETAIHKQFRSRDVAAVIGCGSDRRKAEGRISRPAPLWLRGCRCTRPRGVRDSRHDGASGGKTALHRFRPFISMSDIGMPAMPGSGAALWWYRPPTCTAWRRQLHGQGIAPKALNCSLGRS